MRQLMTDFAEKLRAAKIPFKQQETERGDVIVIPCPMKPTETTVMGCILTTEKHDIAFRVNQFVHIPVEKRAAGLEMMNTLNSKYRHVRFVLDDDNDVHLCMDMPAETRDAADTAMEYFARGIKIMKDCYPDLMKMVWSGNGGNN